MLRKKGFPVKLLYGLKNTKKLLFGNEYLAIKFLIPNNDNLPSLLLDCHITCWFVCPCYIVFTAQKMKFSIKDFFSKCDKIRIWTHLLKKSLMENFIFCVVIQIRVPVLKIIFKHVEHAYCRKPFRFLEMK